MKIKNTFLLALLICIAPALANAADLSVKAPAMQAPVVASTYNWNGFYVGVNGGYGWNRDRGDEFCIDSGGTFNGPSCQKLPSGTTGHINASGALGGAQLGFNWQSGRVVVGFETDIDIAGIRGSTTVNGPFPFESSQLGVATPAGVFNASFKLNSFGTVRGRLGFAPWDRTLVYATGGLAYGHIVSRSLFTCPNVSTNYAGSSSVTKTGWTFGGGLEYALTNNLSTKIEGLYYDLGSVTVIGSSGVSGVSGLSGYQHNKNFDITGAIVRVGFNYRFGGR